VSTAETEAGVPYASQAERVLEEAVAEAPLVEPAVQPQPTHKSSGEDEPEFVAVPTETEAGIPYASQAERVFEEAAAEAPAAEAAARPLSHNGETTPAAPPSPAEEEVQAVTEKPANPRRGWWQRLTQS
jgi:hypothetical protein